jgi:hypothetical protein
MPRLSWNEDSSREEFSGIVRKKAKFSAPAGGWLEKPAVDLVARVEATWNNGAAFFLPQSEVPMRARHLGLVFLTLLCFLAPALVPAVDPKTDPEKDMEPKRKLDELKARLPAVLKKWVKEDDSLPLPYTLELRLCRRFTPYQAKISIVLHPAGKTANQIKGEILNGFLSFHDGCWTTTRFEASWGWSDPRFNRATYSLMLAIDEAGGNDH